MKQLKSFLKILIIFLLVTQNSFAANPIPGIGIVVKKNNCLPNPCKSTCNHGGAIIFTTGINGSFSAKLEIGEYELSFPQDQLKSVINSIIGRNYPKSIYQYDGSGVELKINNPEIIVMLRPAGGNIYTIEAQNSNVIITVARDGTTLSGILGWNDGVMKNSISCPDGFVIQNGKCVPKINKVSQNKGIDKKDIRRNVTESSSDKTKRKGWDGTIKGYVPETGYAEIKPWLAKDGSIVYFEYEEDFLVEDQRMCDALGVKNFTIKKGKYKVNYDNSTTGGKLIWTLTKPINLKNNSNIEAKIFHTTGGKHKHCSEPSNCCVATISSFSINDNSQPFYFKPIVINGNCSTVELQFIDVSTPRPSSE